MDAVILLAVLLGICSVGGIYTGLRGLWLVRLAYAQGATRGEHDKDVLAFVDLAVIGALGLAAAVYLLSVIPAR
jgi:hypothetical protein